MECWVFFAVVFVPPVLACEVWCEGAVEGYGDGGVIFVPVDVQDVLLLAGGEVVPCGFDDGHDGESCRAFGEFCGVFDSLVAVVAVVHGLCLSFFLFSRLVAGGWFCLVCASRVGLLGGGVAAHGGRAGCECEAGAVCAGSVVASQDCEGELRLVSVDHDEDGVFFPAVRVVVVLAVFDACVHDAGASGRRDSTRG